MLFAFLASLGQDASENTQPQETVSAVVVNDLSLGQCNVLFDGTIDSQASIRVSWSLTNADADRFDIRVYQDGVLVSGSSALAGDTTFFDITIGGAVVGGRSPVWSSDWVFRIDVIRKDDALVVSNASSAAWVQTYGGCFNG